MQPSYDAPRKKSNTGLIIGLILGGIGVCCVLPLVGFGGLAFWGFNKVKSSLTCTSAFHDLYGSIEAYAKDHKGTLPPADTWQTAVLPYYSKQIAGRKAEAGIEVMPANGDWGCKTENSVTGIAFNKTLSGKKLDAIQDRDATPLLFEVASPIVNANEPYTPRDNANGPMYIMGQRRSWAVLYADGRLDVRDATGKPLTEIPPNARSGANR